MPGCVKTPEDHARIAKGDAGYEKRAEAVRALNDQRLLVDVAMNARDPGMRGMALAKVTDEQRLAGVAMETRDSKQALFVVNNRLGSEQQLARVAKNARATEVRIHAAKKLNDQQLLHELAKDFHIKKEVIDVVLEKITDTQVLTDLARTAPSVNVRLDAAIRVDDQQALAKIALDAEGNPMLREKAIGKLTDQKLLAGMVVGANAFKYTRDRAAAARRITDQSALADIVRNVTDSSVGQAALKNLTDQQLLWDIAKNGTVEKNSLLALDNLTDPRLLADIAKNAANENAARPAQNIAWRALAKLDDSQELAALARQEGGEELRLRALWRISDKAVLSKLAGDAPNDFVRKIAAARMAETPPQDSAGPVKGNLRDLINEGKVLATMRGKNISVLPVVLTRVTPYPLEVTIPAGTYFVSGNRSTQNMVATEAVTRTLSDGFGSSTVNVPVACANKPKNIPDAGDRFSIGTLPNENELVRLMTFIKGKKVPYATKQAAVWILTDNADYDGLGSLRTTSRGQFGMQQSSRTIKEPEAARAMQLCAEAGIDIRVKPIWNDRKKILSGLPAGALKNWLEEFEES